MTPNEPPQRPTIAEPLAYLGVALVLLFGGLGVSMAWGSMSAPAQVGVLAAAALVLGLASMAVPVDPPAFGRVADTVATTAALLAGWGAGLGIRAADVDDTGALAIGAGVSAIGAVVASRRRGGAIPHLLGGAAGVAAVFWGLQALEVADDLLVVAVLGAGMVWWLLGTAGLVANERVAIVGGGIHVFAATVAIVAVDSAWWVSLPAVAAVGAFVWAGRSGPHLPIQRALAAGTGIAVVARLWNLIDDPALRVVVGGLSVGVALVVAAVSLTRRAAEPTTDQGPTIEGPNGDGASPEG